MQKSNCGKLETITLAMWGPIKFQLIITYLSVFLTLGKPWKKQLEESYQHLALIPMLRPHQVRTEVSHTGFMMMHGQNLSHIMH